jgi:hypothetical protein
MKREKTSKNPKGSGRPPQYVEETVLISLRIPKSLEKQVRDKIKEICEPLVRIKE